MAKAIEVRGLKGTIKNLNKVSDKLGAQGLREPMKRATLVVTADAKKNAPVDTGRLRSSIAPEVQAFGGNVVGIVGTPVKYAPFMELGTRPHFLPLSALRVWARRHGMSAYAVALSIARKGLKARRFLRNAFEKNEGKIVDIFEDYVAKVTKNG